MTHPLPRPVRFRVDAAAEAGTLPRLLQPFARRDLCPDRLRAARHGDVLNLCLDLDAADPAVVPLLEGNLRQVIGVLRVEVELRARLEAAA